MSRGSTLDRIEMHAEARAREILLSKRNWLKHLRGSTGGIIDELLFTGASVQEMAEDAHTTAQTVYMHLNHLRKEHRLIIIRDEGKFRYDLETMKQAGNLERSVKKSTKKQKGS